MPIYAEATHDLTRRAELRTLASRQVVATCLLGLAVGMLGPSLMRLVFPADYAQAAGLLPWIAVGYTFFGLYLIPMNAVSVMGGDTRWVWTSTLAAGAVNVALNLATVPTFGNVAAAVNTAIAYGVLLGLLVAYQYQVARTPIPLAWRRIATAVLVMAVGLGCAILLLPDEAASVITLAGRSAVLLAVTAILWTLFVRGPGRPNTSRGPC